MEHIHGQVKKFLDGGTMFENNSLRKSYHQDLGDGYSLGLLKVCYVDIYKNYKH